MITLRDYAQVFNEFVNLDKKLSQKLMKNSKKVQNSITEAHLELLEAKFLLLSLSDITPYLKESFDSIFDVSLKEYQKLRKHIIPNNSDLKKVSKIPLNDIIESLKSKKLASKLLSSIKQHDLYYVRNIMFKDFFFSFPNSIFYYLKPKGNKKRTTQKSVYDPFLDFNNPKTMIKNYAKLTTAKSQQNLLSQLIKSAPIRIVKIPNCSIILKIILDMEEKKITILNEKQQSILKDCLNQKSLKLFAKSISKSTKELKDEFRYLVCDAYVAPNHGINTYSSVLTSIDKVIDGLEDSIKFPVTIFTAFGYQDMYYTQPRIDLFKYVSSVVKKIPFMTVAKNKMLNRSYKVERMLSNILVSRDSENVNYDPNVSWLFVNSDRSFTVSCCSYEPLLCFNDKVYTVKLHESDPFNLEKLIVKEASYLSNKQRYLSKSNPNNLGKSVRIKCLLADSTRAFCELRYDKM